MIKKMEIFIIKNFIKLTENIQALTNIDIYSTIRIKKDGNLKTFLDKNFITSFHKWKEANNYLKKDLINLHNISYNHWIRSYLSFKISKNNIKYRLFYNLGITYNFILLILFYIRVKIKKIIITKNIKLINGKSNFKYKFISSQKHSRFCEIEEYLSSNFTDKIYYENLNFRYKFQINHNLTKDDKKHKILNQIFRYCLRYPFMAKHYKNMFQGLYIYSYFKKDGLKNNFFSLAKEIYSMETRSLSIASAESNGRAFIVVHNKFEALPYKMYSLNVKKEPIEIEKSLNFKNPNQLKNKNLKGTKNSNMIVIQASDSCGSSISSYEFNIYKDILDTLDLINFRGEIIFKFHPSNINFFVDLKIKICKYFLKNNKNILFTFIHKTKNIEYYAFQSKLMLSIDYSTSFYDILNKSIPIIYFNRNLDRHVINESSKIYNFDHYKMVSSKKELKKELLSLI